MSFIRWPRYITPTYLTQLIRQQKNPLTALQIFNSVKNRDPNYRHNGPVYAAMINVLASSKLFGEMKNVIGQMRNDSCQCKDSLFASIIRTYADAGSIDEALALFYRIPDFNCVSRNSSFNTLLQLLVEHDKLEIAHSFYLSNAKKVDVKAGARSLNILIRALCEKKWSNLALEIFEEMNQQCCYPDRETYSLLMKGLCQDQRLEEATHLLYSMFRRISSKGCGADIVVYRTLLEALCEQGKVQEAVKILSQVLQKGLKIPQRRRILNLRELMAFIEEKGRLGDVKGFINKLLVKGGSPNLESYSAMIEDLYDIGRVDEANELFDEMSERGFWPTVRTYNAKISALCKEGRAGEAAKVLDQMVEKNSVPSVNTYNLLISGLCKQGESARAVGYLRKMAMQVGCVANDKSYRILVEGLCAEGRFIEAASVADKMTDKGYFLSADGYESLIQGLCCQGRKFEAVLWLEEMVSAGKTPAVFAWNSLVTACVGSQRAAVDPLRRQVICL